MATSKSRTTTTSTRRTTSRAAAKPGKSDRAGGDVEVVEEADGMDLDTGVGIVTTFLLVAALVLIDYELGKHLGAGILFKQ